jgi:hypothetical protein
MHTEASWEISWKTGRDNIKIGLRETDCEDLNWTVRPRVSSLRSLDG